MRIQAEGFRATRITHTQKDLLILVYIHTYSLFARRINKLVQFNRAPQNPCPKPNLVNSRLRSIRMNWGLLMRRA